MTYKSYSYFFICAILFVFTNCTPKAETESCVENHKTSKASIIKEINIDVTGKQYNHEFSQTAYFDSTDWYIGLDLSRNCLDIFDLSQQNYYKSLRFKNDGSAGSIEVTDFYFHTKDSIILFSENSKIQITDFENQLVNEWSLRTEKIVDWAKEELTVGFESSVARIYFDPKYKKLYIPSVAPVYYSDDNYFQAPTIVSFSLIKGDFEDIGNFVPDDISNRKVTPNSYSDWYNIVTVDEDQNLIVSYCESNFYTKGQLSLDNNVSLICRKSAILAFENEFGGTISDFNHQMKYTIESGLYRLSFYHPAYNYFITSVRHNQEFKNPSGLLNTTFSAPFSILVLDKSYELLTELLIPKGKYSFNKVYPHSEGVLVMKENPNDENNEEDILEFSVFAID